ncbi:hypothetical protein CPB83DRAFT_665981 [Crepidotus variabilis]|uniref:Uncharacterized protein n=1 Tax=Crepidotus variabilis TaxID=179855 RepID=A0A9P6EN68_9AGAR|nr:hypothetical protein CPB83DRAFT_665981 [Crepidotus variabilis]
MPSLRRTASSPAVRSSPYSSAPVVVRGNPNRRSSGSETTNRRVLADIEWWRVTEGQCDPSTDQELEDHARGTQDLVHLDMSLSVDVPISSVEDGVEHPLSLLSPQDFTEAAIPFDINTIEPPTDQFSALAITPTTPTRSHHSRESSSSSLKCTPKPSDTRLDFGHVFSDLAVCFPDILAPPPALQRRCPSSFVSSAIKRSFTFADCLSLKNDHPNQYADFSTSPLSSAPNFMN